MTLKFLAIAAAASALMAGAAYAQPSTPPAPDTEPATSAPPVPTPDTSVSTTTDATATTSPSDTTATTSASGATATSATSFGAGASVTTTLVTNGPVPDTAENRAKYGQPLSRAGKRTAARGN